MIQKPDSFRFASTCPGFIALAIQLFSSIWLTYHSHTLLAEEAVSFTNDVMPVLSKAGCNNGGCHGALAGKGGFRLSLFGYDPPSDFIAITKAARGRRIDFGDPGKSLFLMKPTTAVVHKGGKRLEPESDDYHLLAKWISQGCPKSNPQEKTIHSLQIKPEEVITEPGNVVSFSVLATYSDGSTRDVTRWAKLSATDATVTSVKADDTVQVIGYGSGAITAWFSSKLSVAQVIAPFDNKLASDAFQNAQPNNQIDHHINETLKQLRLAPSPPCSESTFIRRAFLDTIGRLPTAEEVCRYLDDEAPQKRERLVDLLLARPEYIDYWAYKWSDVFLVSGRKLRPAALQSYADWIRNRVAENTPWNEVVYQVLTATGSSIENGATNFYAVHQDPETMAENTCQAFLSLSINCAKCHNHPLEKWTNDQYYAFANLFARVRAKGWGGDTRNGDGKRTVFSTSHGDLIQPRTGKVQPPTPLDGIPLKSDADDDRRIALAQWMTSADNPYFTRSIVNRVWSNFFGIGLVNPVDDLRTSNPASNEALLDELGRFTIDHRYDLKSLMRLILLSETYSRSSATLPENQKDSKWFARTYPRRLMAEVLADAISDVTGIRDRYTEVILNDGSTQKVNDYDEGTRALELSDSAIKNYFLTTFGRNTREITCECERSNKPSLVQVLHLANGSTINDKLSSEHGWLTQHLATKPQPEVIIETAWLRTLSRMPTEKEKEHFIEMLNGIEPSQLREYVEDLYWSLMTSREFLFRH